MREKTIDSPEWNVFTIYTARNRLCGKNIARVQQTTANRSNFVDGLGRAIDRLDQYMHENMIENPTRHILKILAARKHYRKGCRKGLEDR